MFLIFLFPIKTSCIIDANGTTYLQMSRTKCFIKACLRKWTGVTFQLSGSIEWVGISGHICEITPILTLSLCMLPSHLGVSTVTPGHRNTNTSQTAAFQLHRHTHTQLQTALSAPQHSDGFKQAVARDKLFICHKLDSDDPLIHLFIFFQIKKNNLNIWVYQVWIQGVFYSPITFS